MAGTVSETAATASMIFRIQVPLDGFEPMQSSAALPEGRAAGEARLMAESCVNDALWLWRRYEAAPVCPRLPKCRGCSREHRFAVDIAGRRIAADEIIPVGREDRAADAR